MQVRGQALISSHFPVADAKGRICGAKHSAKNHKKSLHWQVAPQINAVGCMEILVYQYTDCGPIEFEAGLLPSIFAQESQAANRHCKPACSLELVAGARALVFCSTWIIMWLHRINWQNQRTLSWYPQRRSFWSSVKTCLKYIGQSILGRSIAQRWQLVALADWIQHIPRNPTWSHAISQGRIEDGGSLCSAALWAVPQHHDILKALRLRWHQWLLSNNLCKDIAESFIQGKADPSFVDSYVVSVSIWHQAGFWK